MEKGWRRMNIVQILCTHVCKWKMIPVETKRSLYQATRNALLL
jgi:hypothetical protein